MKSSITDLEPNECRYPVGEEFFQFCAAPKHLYLRNDQMRQSPYCSEHHFFCFVVPSPQIARVDA